jgi:hypothetical protein
MAGEVPDHHLAVGLDPGRTMVGDVFEGEDDGIELGLVIGCAALVGEEDLFMGEKGHRVAVTAPVHQDIDPLGQDRCRKEKQVMKRVLGSAREGHRVHQPLPGNPFTMQPGDPSGAAYQRITLAIFKFCALFLKIAPLAARFNDYRVKIR